MEATHFRWRTPIWCTLHVTIKHNHRFAGLDYLASPSSVIRYAQEMAAKAFGAEETWFLVNGTSVGIHAAALATCGPDKSIVLARNCHQSAFAATVFAGECSVAACAQMPVAGCTLVPGIREG